MNFENIIMDKAGNLYKEGECIYKNTKYDYVLPIDENYALGVFETKNISEEHTEYDFDCRIVSLKKSEEICKADFPTLSSDDVYDDWCFFGKSLSDKNLYYFTDNDYIFNFNIKTGKAIKLVTDDIDKLLKYKVFDNDIFAYIASYNYFAYINRGKSAIVEIKDKEGNTVFKRKDLMGGYVGNDYVVAYGGRKSDSLECGFNEIGKNDFLYITPEGDAMPLFNENSKIFKDYDLENDEGMVSAEFYEDSFVISVTRKNSDGEYIGESYVYDLSKKSGFKNIVIIVLVCVVALAFAIVALYLKKRKNSVAILEMPQAEPADMSESVADAEDEEAEDKTADEVSEEKTEQF